MKMPTKAVILAAGLGTRFLPQTKAMPKEMLPIIDRPVIQLIVEEVVAAGVTDIIMVTGSTKRAIEDHFDRSDELERELREGGKEDKAEQIKAIAEMANFVYLRQKGTPKGNARPLLNAQHLIDDDEPFFVYFADDFFRSKMPRSVSLLRAYERTGKSVITLTRVDKKDADKYGMAELGDDMGGGVFTIPRVVEKPGEQHAPSEYASVGGYLLTPDIIPIVAREEVDAKGEITLLPSINELAMQGKVCGCLIDGIWHDAGDQLKYLMAVVDVALEDERLGATFAEYLKKRLY